MDDKVKRVMKALAEADGYGDLQEAHERTLHHYSKLAAAAIEAMQEDIEKADQSGFDRGYGCAQEEREMDA